MARSGATATSTHRCSSRTGRRPGWYPALACHDLPPFWDERRRRGADLVDAARDNSALWEARWTGKGPVATPIFYGKALAYDWRSLWAGRSTVGLGLAGSVAAALAFPFLRFIDAVGIVGALLRRSIGTNDVEDLPSGAADDHR